MNKRFIIIFILCTVISFTLGYYISSKSHAQNDFHTQEISYEELHKLMADGAPFILFVGRPSCRYCAVVASAVLTMDCEKLPIFYFSLEQFINTRQYESIKDELEITYLPSFKYIKNGAITYNLNNPLDYDYFEHDGAERLYLYNQMMNKVNNFINGAFGNGPVIDEPLITESKSINAIPVEGGKPVD